MARLVPLQLQPLLAVGQCAAGGLDLGHGLDETLEVLDDGGDLLAHLGVDEELVGGDEGSGDHQVGEGELVADEELAAVLDGGLDLLEGADELGGGGVVGGLVKGDHLGEAHEHGGQDVGADLALGEGSPLLDLGKGPDVAGAEKLGGLGTAGGDELGDGGTLSEVETVGGLESGDLAEGELLGELLGLVGHAHLEVGVNVELEAIEGSNGFGLFSC